MYFVHLNLNLLGDCKNTKYVNFMKTFYCLYIFRLVNSFKIIYLDNDLCFSQNVGNCNNIYIYIELKLYFTLYR